MDSVTQLVLGGTVAYAVLGKELGRKAALYGAVLGTIPDLDVFIEFGNPVKNFIFHRSFSHSLLVHLLVTPLLGWLLTKLHLSTKTAFNRCCLGIFLSLSTHALLDTCTVYGTQLLWPLTSYPFAISNVFIIDPLYSIPLLLAFGALLFVGNQYSRMKRFNLYALLSSSAYLIWCVGAKVSIDNKVHQALAKQGIVPRLYESTPAPFTSLLWRCVAVVDDGYYEIYASVFDKVKEVSIDKYPTAPQLLADINNVWEVRRLAWFTKGLYAVSLDQDNVVMTDLRMGMEAGYVFNFRVGQWVDGKVVPGDMRRESLRPALKVTKIIYKRIWDPSISLSPSMRQHDLAPLSP